MQGGFAGDNLIARSYETACHLLTCTHDCTERAIEDIHRGRVKTQRDINAARRDNSSMPSVGITDADSVLQSPDRPRWGGGQCFVRSR